MALNEIVKELLSKLTDSLYLYTASGNAKPPYIVYGVDGANDLTAGNVHSERADQGFVDLYTKSPSDALINGIIGKLEEGGVSYYLNSVQYEDETGLLHYEWIFEV